LATTISGATTSTRFGRLLGLALAGILASCVGTIRSIAPANLLPVPVDSAERWSRAFRPDHPLEFNLRWAFENREGRAAGRAVARYAPPDTLRFDYRGPFGRSGSALVVGDSAVWSEPEGDIDDLVPVAPVLWAALGIVSVPETGQRVLGAASDEQRAWRYVDGTRALDYIHVLRPEPRLLAELRELETILGVVDVELDTASTAPRAAVMRFPAERSEFSLTVRSIDRVSGFAPDTWQRP
jgi:hypothetical protein